MPPAYVLSPFDDPLGVNPLSPSPVSAILAPPGFAPIGLPGSLAMPLVVMDVLPPDFPPPGSPVLLVTSGPLSPRRVQPVLNETSGVCRFSSPSICMPAVDSPVVSVLPGRELVAAGCSRTGRAFVSGCVVELLIESPFVVFGFGAVGRILL